MSRRCQYPILNFPISLHYIPFGTLIVVLTLICGCQNRHAENVEPELARETLVRVLETWKSGGTIEALSKQEPQIVVQEALWSNGGKLVDFRIIDGGREEDANLFCEVELTLEREPGGPVTKKKVTYVVGTDPVLTVFHAIL